MKVSANFAASQFLQPLTEDSSHFHVCSLSQDLLSASCDLVLQATYGDVSSQPYPTSSNHSTTNIIKTPLLIMVNTICLHEGCKRKPMKHGNGSCHLHGVHRKCSFPQLFGKAQFQTECPYSGDKRRVTYFYRQVNGTPPADPVSPLDISDELSKSNLLQRDCMRLGRAGGELLAESLGDVSVQTMPLCNG